MKAFISNKSALEFWRVQLVLPCGDAQKRCRVALDDTLPDTEHVRLPGLTLPVHILLGKADMRRRREEMTQHVFTGKTPVGCFFNVDDTLFVCSPEFCFLQMANKLPLGSLVELGYELCGSYSIHTAGDPNVPARGFHLREPLTSTKRLTMFASRMKGVKGHLKAVRALRYVLDGSASPMETKLSILLTLPYRLGGFGLPKPKMNARVDPRKSDRRTGQQAGLRQPGKGYYVCDLFWPDEKVAVEYDSNLFHTGSAHITEDSKKRNALKAMGIGVITVTTQQIYDKREFETVARSLAKDLGKRLVYKNPGFDVAHNELRRLLRIESGWPQ